MMMLYYQLTRIHTHKYIFQHTLTHTKIGRKTTCRMILIYNDKRFHLWVQPIGHIRKSGHKHPLTFTQARTTYTWMCRMWIRLLRKGCYNTYLSFYYDITVDTGSLEYKWTLSFPNQHLYLNVIVVIWSYLTI